MNKNEALAVVIRLAKERDLIYKIWNHYKEINACASTVTLYAGEFIGLDNAIQTVRKMAGITHGEYINALVEAEEES